MIEYPEFVTVEWCIQNGLFPTKVFVDGVEVAEAEVACVDDGYVVAADLNEEGRPYVITGSRDVVVRRIVHGTVTFEHNAK